MRTAFFHDFTHPLHLVAGLAVWEFWFSAVYGGLSVACQIAPPPAGTGVYNWINAALLAGTLLVASGLFACAFRCWCHQPGKNRQQAFNLRIAAVVYAAGGMGTLAIGAPLMVVPPCV